MPKPLAAFLACVLAGSPLAADEPSARARRVDFANDLGPETIDVSDYPEGHRRTYREQFLRLCGVCHSPARAVNAELVELPADALKDLQRRSPGLLDDPRVLRAEPHLWKHYIKRMKMRPPCCGACPVMTDETARDVWSFLVYDSQRRKLGAAAPAWRKHRRSLLDRFQREHPARYRDLYGPTKEEHP